MVDDHWKFQFFHYEAKPGTQTLRTFIEAIHKDATLPPLVRSVRFHHQADDLEHSGLIDLMNEILSSYMFTDTNALNLDDSNAYRPITACALRFKAIQIRSLHLMGINPPADAAIGIHKQYLKAVPFSFVLGQYIRLFDSVCKNWKILEIPSSWEEHMMYEAVWTLKSKRGGVTRYERDLGEGPKEGPATDVVDTGGVGMGKEAAA